MAPGEHITIRLYSHGTAEAVPVTISSETSFRPADVEPGNSDLRLLGGG